MKSKLKKILLALCAAGFVASFLKDDDWIIPVAEATPRDWNPKSFWYSPWGPSGVHKGIDIFAKEGTRVLSASNGVVLYHGHYGMGGTVVWVLGPKWRLHYYAHLSSTCARTFSTVHPGTTLGRVGNSGNAAGKPPHLHYAIRSMVPLPWLITTQAQGWQRMFFIDPNTRLHDASSST